jgi:hypothetical protein
MFRKMFGIYGLLNIIKAICIFGVLLIGPKALLFFIPQKAVFVTYLLFACLLYSTPLANVAYVEMSVGHKKLLTYFRHISAAELRSYYTYRKFFLFLLCTLYLFFPLSVAALPASLFIMTLLSIVLLIKTSVQVRLKDEKKTKYVNNGLQIMFVGLFILLGNHVIDAAEVAARIAQVPGYYYGIVSLLCYSITFINVGRSYLLSGRKMELTRQPSLIKNHQLLYIIRSGLLVRLLTILAFSFFALEQPLLTPFGFALTVLTSYSTIYYNLLRNDEGKVPLFYDATSLHKIRHDKLEPILKCSLFYLLLAIILGLYTGTVVGYSIAYMITTSVFALSVRVLKINIEKRQDEKVITWQNFVKIAVFNTIIVVFLASLL